MPKYSREAIRALAGQPVKVRSRAFCAPQTKIGCLIAEDTSDSFGWMYFTVVDGPVGPQTPYQQVTRPCSIELIELIPPEQITFGYNAARLLLHFPPEVGEEDRIIYPEKSAVLSAQYPHICPKCSSPAYIGIRQVDCSKCGGQDTGDTEPGRCRVG
jgi:hypothetical protein